MCSLVAPLKAAAVALTSHLQDIIYKKLDTRENREFKIVGVLHVIEIDDE